MSHNSAIAVQARLHEVGLPYDYFYKAGAESFDLFVNHGYVLVVHDNKDGKFSHAYLLVPGSENYCHLQTA